MIWLGHTRSTHRRASTTSRYVHPDDATLSQAVERAARAIQCKLLRVQAPRLAEAARFE